MKATSRFCMHCMKITLFRYDKNMRHSYCKICGASSLFATHDPVKPEQVERVLQTRRGIGR